MEETIDGIEIQNHLFFPIHYFTISYHIYLCMQLFENNRYVHIDHSTLVKKENTWKTF